MSNPGHEFTRLVEIMRTLRSPEGCPWDRAQTLGSLTEFVLEEAHEVVDAIERDDLAALGEEIGDHIFEGVFLAQIAAEMGAFTVSDALRAVADKLVRRHPHVFQPDGRVHDAASKERAPSADAALSRWDAQKAQERGGAAAPDGALGTLPGSLPALRMAYKLGKRAAFVGFDWTRPEEVVAKIREEVDEVAEAVARMPPEPADVEDEMGDLLFAIANLARKVGVEPETALRRANAKFRQRFRAMEGAVTRAGRMMAAMTLDELEEEWQRAKAAESRPPAREDRHG
jgi:ATP diphosphatase